MLFDLGDTLVRLAPFPGDVAGRLVPRLAGEGAGTAGARALAETIAAAMAAATAEAQATGAREEVDLAAVAARCLRSAGWNEALGFARSLADAHGEADLERIHPVAGRGALLQELRDRGLRLAIVSNTTTRGDLLTEMLQRFGLLPFFDAVVYSSAVGVRKPHAEIFHAALDALGVASTEAIFVGDRLREDVLGPQALGMRGVLTREFHASAHAGEPFAVIDRLDDIVPVVFAV